MKKHYYLLFTILIASLSFGQIASDDFTYSDGSLVGNGAWVTHSGTAGDLLVSSGQVVVQHGTPSEDANLPFTPVSGVLYFGIDFTVDSSSDIPGSDNEYFAHFKDSGNGFRARLDVVPGTAGGNYTVGISSSTSTAQATWGTDLSFGVTYRAIAKYDQDNGLAELWIDASSSGDTSISGNTATATSIESFALRQSDSDNNETITVDNLVVGQTFAEALGASSTTESIPWSDDLEGDLSEFTTYQASSGTGMWAITTSRYHSGAQSVYHSDATGDHDSWLLTPTFDLSGATAPELIYWDNENYYTYYVNHEVLVSEDYTDDVAAATWVELADGVSDEDTWVERGPLALPTTGTVTVAFRYEGNYADAWYLDDISVAEAPTAASADWSVSAAEFSDSATVSVTVDNFTVTNDGTGDGHWHYTLDGGSAVMVYDTNDFTLTGLSSGSHTLVAGLVDNSHADLSPAVEETITWTQTNAPGCGESLSYDYTTGSSGGYNFDANFTGPDAADLLFTSTVVNTGDEMTVTLGGTTESGYDWVYVTDGAGTVLQAPISGTMGDVAVTSTDGTVNVYLASDSSVTSGPVTFTVTCVTPSTTESIPWSDDLEGDLSEFTTYQASSGTGMWAITTSRYHSGAQSVYHSDATGDHDSWLLTPTFDLSGATAPELIYWDNENYYTYYVNHEVLVSEDYTDDVAAATWVELADGVSDEDTWVERGPLALPTTGTVTVAFRYEGNYADAWYLDDISVAEAPVTYESIPWSDDFETGDFSAGWTSSEAAGAPTSLWEVSNLANNTSGGAYSARHNYSTAGTFDSYLVGPTFDLSGASSPAVSYSDFVDWSGDADVHSLVYSEDYTDDVDAATWVVLNDVLGSEDTWVANGPYALPTSGTVTIAFRYQGYYAAEWFIDDVNVEEDTMSIDDEDILDMRIYPNPVDGNFVTILSPVNGTKYIQVFDINGRRVMDTSINNNMLDVSSINSGFYMIKVTIDGQSKISKLVVR